MCLIYALSHIQSSEPRQSPFLDLRQRAATADESHKANDSRGGQGLEQVPGGVVQEEDTLDRKDRPEEDGMRDGRIAQCLAKVVGVRT